MTIRGYKFGSSRIGIGSNGRNATHWNDCWSVHHDCALAHILKLYEILEEARCVFARTGHPLAEKIEQCYPSTYDE